MDRNWQDIDDRETIAASLSARRAWIEIENAIRVANDRSVALRKESVDRNVDASLLKASKTGSLSARRAWIEITVVGVLATLVTASLSARRAWIEIKKIGRLFVAVRVALRKESVDRNIFFLRRCTKWMVALRKESVDRNNDLKVPDSVSKEVALRKESVDRNLEFRTRWELGKVALRKESVDRNTLQNFIDPLKNGRSPQGERG